MNLFKDVVLFTVGVVGQSSSVDIVCIYNAFLAAESN